MRSVFVTVGTTKFDALLQAVTSQETLRTLVDCGYTHLTIQYGAGLEPATDHDCGLVISSFQYRPTIRDLISDADLVISHSGAGTVLETLGAGKPMIAVINEQLMDNHQTELAHQMYKDGHLLYCTVKDLRTTINDIQSTKLTPYVRGDPKKFANFLDKVMGLE